MLWTCDLKDVFVVAIQCLTYFIAQIGVGGMGACLTDKIQMCQHIKLIMDLHAGKGLLQIPALCLFDGLVLPVGRKVHIQPIHKVNGTQNEIKGPPLQVLLKLTRLNIVYTLRN